MKKNLLLSSLLTAGSLAMAQDTYTHQYFFSSGGQFMAPGNKVSVGYVKNDNVAYIDNVRGDFSNAVNVFHNESLNRYEGIAHIGRAGTADKLVRYDLDTYRAIDSTTSSGVTGIARNADKIVVIKGYESTGAKVDILSANFDSLTSFYDIKNDCKSVKIFGDYAYVSHSDSVGRISVINLKNNTLTRTLNLGKKAVGISNMVLTPGPSNWVTIYISGGPDSTYQFPQTLVFSKQGLDVLEVTNKNVFGIQRTSPAISLVKIDIASLVWTVSPGAINSGSFKWDLYAKYDTASNDYLVMRTNYAGPGSLIRMDGATSIDSFAVKPSATAFEIDYRPSTVTALFASNKSSVSFKAFPNPCREVLTVQTSAAHAGTAQIVALDGRIIASYETEVSSELRISTVDLEKGMYTLSLKGEKGVESFKFIKE